MNRGAKAGVIGTCVLLLGGGGFGAYRVVHGVNSTVSSNKAAAAATEMSTTPPSAADAVKRAQSFLDSWHAGPTHYPGAASQTNDPSDTQTELQTYADGLKLTSVAFTDVAVAPVGTASADPDASPSQDATGATGATAAATTGSDGSALTHVTFTVTATIHGGTWTYPGAMDIEQNVGGLTSVRWAPSVLYPKLQDGQQLVAGPVSADPSDVKVVADDGKTVLTAAKYPSLKDIISTVAKSGSGNSAASGSGVEVEDAAGEPLSTAKVFTAPKAATITTTIDAGLQASAEAGVRNSVLKGLPASVVAIDHSNGHIRAVAYANTGGDGDTAIDAALAPGSTMKIITSAALFDNTSMTPTSPAPCTPSATVWGETWTNDSPSDTDPNASLTKAFAISCNASFINAGFDKLVTDGDASALNKEATQVFGLGSWSIGGKVQTTDPAVPVPPKGGDQGAQFMGQGKITMSPLVIASLSATVAEGHFEQPIIMPDQKQQAAPEPLSARTDGYLKTLMRAAAHDTDGTAYPRMKNFPSSSTGAKTGTAETAATTNGWFTAYDSKIAVAALVQGGKTGVDSAGYVVQAVLDHD